MSIVSAGFAIILFASSLSSAPISEAFRRQEAVSPVTGMIEKGDFRIAYDGRGVTAINCTGDRQAASLLSPGQRLEPSIRYRVPGGDWLEAFREATRLTASPGAGPAFLPRRRERNRSENGPDVPDGWEGPGLDD